MELTKKITQVSKKYKTPFLIVNPRIIEENYKRIKESFRNIEIYYAMKANPNIRILKLLKDIGCGFEIASTKELDSLLKIKAPSSLIISANPVKAVEFIEFASQNKISVFVFDSKEEVDKLAQFAPNSNVCARLSISNIGSDWPLSGKFGLSFNKIIPLLKYAQRKKLVPYGLTFHVGSQCRNKLNWINALKKSSQLFKLAKRKGLTLKLLSLGGGLPIKHLKEVPTVEEIGQDINKIIKKLFPEGIRVTIEPGRALVGNAAILVGSVIGMAERKKEKWLYLDIGVFQGLMETVGGIIYKVQTERDGKLGRYMLAGPTCDSFDKMFSCYLPKNLKIGERIYMINAGAYTTAYASDFDGFSVPKTYFLK